jgi:proline dehydrogenase
MLRSFFIYLSKAGWARNLITNWNLVWRMANRFIAGEQLDEAIYAVNVLNEKGINATLDHLGEHTVQKSDAVRACHDILEIISSIDQHQIRSGISIKLSQIGLALGEDFCFENLISILEIASQKNIFIRIDMEDSTTVDATLRIFHRIQSEYGFRNGGVVIQSYLYRSEADVHELLKSGTKIRLCKGAYKEPPDVAYPAKKDVDASFDRIAKMLLDASMRSSSPDASEDGRIPPIPAIATHDIRRIEFVQKYANANQIPKNRYEFQMLHGIRRDIQETLVKEGYLVRVYVPYGTQWYPYFMRRLAERPANVWFLASNLLRR